MRRGEREWVVLDVLHREALDGVLAELGPDPVVYRASVAALGIEQGEAMMVAAHHGDLVAAAECGLRTAFVARPREYGPAQRTDLRADSDVDVEAGDFEALAGALGA